MTDVLDARLRDGKYRLRWWAAAVLIVAALMDLIDTTIVNVALPTIQRDLGADGTSLEWVVSAYLLAFASTLITAGRLGDLLGRRRLFLVGVAGFGVASLICGCAQTPGQLIAARALQGVAAATLAPQVLATFREMFRGKERGRAFGLYGAMAGLASALGLLLGGVLTQADIFGLGWRTIFIVNVPIAAIAFGAALLTVPETRALAPRRPDLLGTVVLVLALIAVVYPLLEGRSLGWPPWCWALLAAGPLAIAGLAAVDARRAGTGVAPLVPTALFRIPAFSAGVVVYFMLGAALIGFFLVLTLWLQVGEAFSPTRAGITGVAFSAGSILTAGAAVPLATRFGRLVLTAGSLMLAVGFGLVRMVALHATGPVGGWSLVPGLLVAGAGLGLLIVPLINVVLSAVPREVAGEASGVFNTSQQLGGAVGVAVVGTVFFGYADQAGHSLTTAFTHSVTWAIGGFVACGLLALLLPRTAVSEVAP